MKLEPLRTLIAGIIGGAFVGLLVAAYVDVLSADYVIEQGDYSHAVFYEAAQTRFAATIYLSFIIAFAAIGPVMAAATFGTWLRHAVYGLVAGVGMAAVVSLIGAAATNQQPFNTTIGSRADWITFGLRYGVPAGTIIGTIGGILFGRRHDEKTKISPGCAESA